MGHLRHLASDVAFVLWEENGGVYRFVETIWEDSCVGGIMLDYWSDCNINIF